MVNSIAASSYTYVQATSVSISATAQNAIEPNNNGAQPAPPADFGGDRGGGFLQSVLDTFKQLGVDLPQPGQQGSANSSSFSLVAISQTTQTTQTTAADSSDSLSAGQDIGRALHEFLHTLFQAAREAGGGNDINATTSAPPPAPGNGPSRDLGNDLQSLLQQLTSGNSSETSDKLNEAFKNLLTAVNGAAGADGSSSTAQPTLTDFIQSLVQNLQNHTGSLPRSTGSVVATSA